MNFQDNILSIPIDSSKTRYVLVFDLTSMQHATDNCRFPKLVGEPLRPELNFIFPLKHVTELIVLVRVSSVAVDKFVVGKNSKLAIVSLQQIPLLKYRYLGSFPCDYVPTLDNDTFANINRQPSSVQGEHWIMIASFCHKLYFADSIGREMYNFFKQQYKQMMPRPLQSHPSVGGFYTSYAAFHLFRFR